MKKQNIIFTAGLLLLIAACAASTISPENSHEKFKIDVRKNRSEFIENLRKCKIESDKEGCTEYLKRTKSLMKEFSESKNINERRLARTIKFILSASPERLRNDVIVTDY